MTTDPSPSGYNLYDSFIILISVLYMFHSYSFSFCPQGNYRLAKQHYTIALRYDPHNKMLLENIAKISRLEYNKTSNEINTGELYDLLVEL